MPSDDEIEWRTIRVVEARVRGHLYRIEEPPGCGGQVNVYRDGEFVGPASCVGSAKDAIARGLT